MGGTKKSWKYVGCKTWTNWRTTGIKGGILKIILHKLCGTAWIGFIWFRREKRCWFKHDNKH